MARQASDLKGFNVFMSNSEEILVGIGAEIMCRYPLSDPFYKENIVVMNDGMATYLSQSIAKQNQIEAMCDYKQVWQLIYYIHRLCHPAASRIDLYNRDHLTWNILAQITSWQEERVLLKQAAALDKDKLCDDALGIIHSPFSLNGHKEGEIELFDKLSHYLNNDRYGQKAYELAYRVASTFDQYQMYRPQWIMEWNNLPISTFDEYERNPDDPCNPINKFIEKECRKFFEHKSGFLASQASQAQGFSSLNDLSAKGSDERSLVISKERLNRVRNLFKSNVWQIKLWCLLRYNLSLHSTDDYRNILDPESREFDWWICHLDRSSVVVSLINLLKRASNLENLYEILLSAEQEDIKHDQLRSVTNNNLARLGSFESFKRGFYERVFVYGVSSMPRVVVEFLAALSKYCSVNVMLLNPCQDYWGDIAPSYRNDFEQYVKKIQSSIKAPESKFKSNKTDHQSEKTNKAMGDALADGEAQASNEHLSVVSDAAPEDDAKEIDSVDGAGSAAGSGADNTDSLLESSKYLKIPALNLFRHDYDDAGERIEGHPLLLSLGKQGKDYISMLMDRVNMPELINAFSPPQMDSEFSYQQVVHNNIEYTEVSGGSLLGFIQSQLLNLNKSHERYVIRPNDKSFVIHSCHTKRREVEVLHDAILECFNQAKIEGRTLYPHDIVVMVPAIKDYAPHIEAVFGGHKSEKIYCEYGYLEKVFSDNEAVFAGNYEERKAAIKGKELQDKASYIPFLISDQSEEDTNSVCKALLKLLEVGFAHVTASYIIDLLSEDSIANRFEISKEDVEIIAYWLREANIFWGIDSDDVSECSQLELPCTIEQGLERMMLGTLIGESDKLPVFSSIDGYDVKILGKLDEFLMALKELRTRFTPNLRLPPSQWTSEIQKCLVANFFADTPETMDALEPVKDYLTMLNQTFEHLKDKPDLTLSVLAASLRKALSTQEKTQSFLGEKVTFCSLAPMRSVPFEHIFILGLNDGDFPREDVSPGFNLLGNKELFERGDRSSNNEDRYLFLEALLSARRSIYLSYIGQSPTVRTELNPSIVLSDLLYYVVDNCALQGHTEVTDGKRQQMVEQRVLVHEHLNSYAHANFLSSDYELIKGSSREDVKQGDHSDCNEAPSSAKQKDKKTLPAKAQDNGKYDRSNALAPTVTTHYQRIPSFQRDLFSDHTLSTNQSSRQSKPVGIDLVIPPDTNHLPSYVNIGDFFACIKDPCKFFLRKALKFNMFPTASEEVVDEEAFDLSTFNEGRYVNKMIFLNDEGRKNYLAHESLIGSLPYGIFNDKVSYAIKKKLGFVQDAMALHLGCEEIKDFRKLICPKSRGSFNSCLPGQVVIPKVLIAPEILERALHKYAQAEVNAKEQEPKQQINQQLTLDIEALYLLNLEYQEKKYDLLGKALGTSKVSEQKPISAEDSSAISSDEQTAADTNADSQDKNTDVKSCDENDAKSLGYSYQGTILHDEDLKVFRLDLLATCNPQPWVFNVYTDGSSDEIVIKDMAGNDLVVADMVINSPNLVWACLHESIAQYLYDGSFKLIKLIDNEGNLHEFLPYDVQGMHKVLTFFLVFFTLAHIIPIPTTNHFIKHCCFDNGDLAMDDIGLESFGPNQKSSDYMFIAPHKILKYESIDKLLKEFLSFYYHEVGSHVVATTRTK